MPALQAYSRDLPYSYALGLFPASELMKKRPELARRLLVSSKAENSEGLAALRVLCSRRQVREEQADKALARVSGKENCFAAVVFALIRPAADAFDPHVVRASMGAIFGLNVRYYDNFEAYREEFPHHALYPFMLDASMPLDEASAEPRTPFSLIMGNEGSGLPPEFAHMGQAVRIPHSDEIDSLNLSVAAAIGMYVFAERK